MIRDQLKVSFTEMSSSCMRIITRTLEACLGHKGWQEHRYARPMTDLAMQVTMRLTAAKNLADMQLKQTIDDTVAIARMGSVIIGEEPDTQAEAQASVAIAKGGLN